MRLDLACGRHPADGYEGVDTRDLGQPWQVDLTKYPWPWPDSSVEALRSSHYVEHVTDLVAFMNECHRILTPGGELVISCPYQHSDRAWQDPTHVRALNLVSWDYYDADKRAGLGDEYDQIVCDFEVVAQELVMSAEADKVFGGQIPPWMIRYCVNVVDDITVTLKKR